MNKQRRIQLIAQLDLKRRRLADYIAKEEKLLNSEAQSYSLGTRSKSKYNVTLEELRKAITQLENEIKELENLLYGKGSRKAVSIIPAF